MTLTPEKLDGIVNLVTALLMLSGFVGYTIDYMVRGFTRKEKP